MKKRFFIIGLSPNVGGVESYVINLVRNINREQYEIYYPVRNNQQVAYQKELIGLGIQPIVISYDRHHFIKYYKEMNRIYEEYHFDVVYFNNCDMVSIDPLYFAYKHGVPVRIMHSHSSDNTSKPNKFYHRIMEWWSNKKLDKYATHLFACSEAAGKWMFGDRDFTVIHNGIDLQKYYFDTEKRKELRIKYNVSDKIVVGFVGRISIPKNPSKIIRIFNAVHQLNRNSILWVVGDGELKAEMSALAKQLGIGDSIIFWGARQDVHELMNAMDCFLLPSLWEGLPFVLVEAQANGLPCVVSTAVSEEANIGGLLEYLDLEQPPEYWAEEVIAAAQKGRTDVRTKLIEAGYSIKDTIDEVSEIIENSLELYNESSR